MSLRIAMIGQRGVPATWGGIEHHVEHLGAELVARGHSVTVFCRNNYVEDAPKEHRGMRLVSLPTVATKHLDAIAHSALSTVAALPSRYDVLHYHAIGPGLLTPVARVLGRGIVAQTIHGFDDERAKWSRGAQAVLRVGRSMSARVPHLLITVSEAMAETYRRQRGNEAVAIPNGVPAPTRASEEHLRDLGVTAGRFVLFMGRWVPEKAPDVLLRAFRTLPGDWRLVVAGDSSFTEGYAGTVKALAAEDPRVVLPGYVFGARREALYSHAAAFVLPSLLEGLPITLLEAASYDLPIVASAIPPHVEVLGVDAPGSRLVPAGDPGALAAAIAATLGDLRAAREGAARTGSLVRDRYRWSAVAAQTEAAYEATIARHRPRRRNHAE